MARLHTKTTGRLTTLLKLAAAGAIIFWMWHSGRLDLHAIARAGTQPSGLVAIATLFYLQIFLMALRWRILAAAVGFEIATKDSFSLSMIGMLFNTALPGSISGDVIKAYYAGRNASLSGPVASIVVDRMVGMFSLMMLAVLAGAWDFPYLARNSSLRTFWLMLSAALVAGAAFLAVALAASQHMTSALERFQIYGPVRALLLKIVGVLSLYNRKRFALLQALGLSIPVHLSACLAFYIATRGVSQTAIKPDVLLFVVPLGLATTVVPLAPAGIGVGQAAFYAIIQFVLPGEGALGANAFTIYQAILLLVSLSGIFAYLRYKTESLARAGAAGQQ